MKPPKVSDAALKSVVDSLDDAVDAASLADRAKYSTAQYYRIVKQSLQDPPMTIRRRLLMERAAFELTRTRATVTEVGVNADFDSLAGFSRSFKKVFGVAPLQYRRLCPTDYRIDAKERIHYAPPAAPVGPRRQGELNMKLLERLIDHHCWSMHRILDACREIEADQLDKELPTPPPFPWCDGKETIRTLLKANCGFARPWLASINGEELAYDESNIDGLHEGLDQNCEKFSAMAVSIEAEGRWDMTFVDALCEPPEVFSYIGVAGHVITFNANRRIVLISALKQIGITGLGFGDPIEYDPARRSA
jgi:AraC family transcriptional regulator